MGDMRPLTYCSGHMSLIPGLPTQVLSETSPTQSTKGCTSHRLFPSCSRQSPEIKAPSGLGGHLISGVRVCVCPVCVGDNFYTKRHTGLTSQHIYLQLSSQILCLLISPDCDFSLTLPPLHLSLCVLHFFVWFFFFVFVFPRPLCLALWCSHSFHRGLSLAAAKQDQTSNYVGKRSVGGVWITDHCRISGVKKGTSTPPGDKVTA